MVSINVNRKKQKGNNGNKVPVSERIIEFLELPKDIVLNLPKITMMGNRSIIITNYESIIEFDSGKVKLATVSGSLMVKGKYLDIREINAEEISITGEINQLEFT